MSHFVGKSALAHMVGVTPAAITKACNKNFPDAVKSGKIDICHPQVVEYLHGRKLNSPKKTKTVSKSDNKGVRTARSRTTNKINNAEKGKGPVVELHPDDGEPDDGGWRMPTMLEEVAEDIHVDPEQIEHMTLVQLGARFGTRLGLLDYIKALKDLEDIKTKRIKNAKDRGKLVPREEIKKMFSFVENAHSRLAADTPPRLAGVVHGMIDDDTTKEDIEEEIRKQISSQLKGVKQKVSRAFTRLKKQSITTGQANAAT